MSDSFQSPKPEESSFAGASNNELAITRTELASDRTDLAEIRTDLAKDRNRLAAERTLMAWIRTSLSMISFGFGIDRFFTYLKQSQTGTSVNQLTEERVLGLGLIVLGVVALAGGTLNYWRVLKNLESPRYKYNYASTRSFAITIAIVLVFIGLASYVPIITKDVSFKEIITLNSQIVTTLVSFSVFAIMLSLGAALSVSDLLAFWQQPTLVARSLLAIVIIPPIVLAAILSVTKLPETFVLALIFMIAAPGPALLTKRAGTAGARLDFTLSLQITLALLAILVTPLILKFFAVFYSGSELTVNAMQVAKQVGLVQFLPLGIGIAIATIWKDVATEIVELISTVANTLFIIQVLIIFIISWEIVPALGTTILIATALITLLGLVIGQVASIGLAPNIQSGIAVATIARNAGLAIALAALNGQANVIPVIVGVLIVGIIVGVPYSAWMKRKVRTAMTVGTASISS
ncbi:DUF202 domain-containing protein [Myxosarcina sp. GI1]|uniref:DUF202 domain-containing protein n=1 Tax=Myxosarcina sp. GI1 TaxID=1541065 RepID=UPI000568BBD8|nr:DUF202 domain-containing protein [Myxosarcina sp. GI1]